MLIKSQDSFAVFVGELNQIYVSFYLHEKVHLYISNSTMPIHTDTA